MNTMIDAVRSLHPIMIRRRRQLVRGCRVIRRVNEYDEDVGDYTHLEGDHDGVGVTHDNSCNYQHEDGGGCDTGGGDTDDGDDGGEC